MTLVESLQLWKEAVESYNLGDFQTSLSKFKEMKDATAKISFNIGRTYMSLCDIQAALMSFQDVIKKDKHLAVGHFMLGVVNLMCARYADALGNFNETLKNLRESKFIDYRQLGLKYKLYKCEVLLNRAVCLSSLGNVDSAVADLLIALQCKAEPRHNIIDISLNNLQNGQGMEFIVMDAIFQPAKSKTANLEKRDYLGKSQVVVDNGNYEKMETPLALRGRLSTGGSTTTPEMTTDSGELYRVLYDFIAQNENEVSVKAGDFIEIVETADDGWFTMITNDSRKRGLVPGSYVTKYDNSEELETSREALLKDLRKKETRSSLRRVQPSLKTHHNSTKENEHIYANGYQILPQKERSKSADSGGYGGERPTSKPKPKVEPKIHAGPPKFRRKNSLENLLSSKQSPKASPILPRKSVDVKKPINNNVSDNDDGGDYEEMAEISEVKPYAVRDVIDNRRITIYCDKKAPARPAPPPKLVTTMKPSPPTAVPRVSRANTTSTMSSVFEYKRSIGSPPNPPQKPTKTIPKIPPTTPKTPPTTPKTPTTTPKTPTTTPKMPRNFRNSSSKEDQNVSLQFTVTTSFTVKASTTAEDIQNAAEDAIKRSFASSLWCEKDGKRFRLDTANISNLVVNGQLKISCGS